MNIIKKDGSYSVRELKKASIKKLEERNVTVKDIAEIVYLIQKDYQDDLSFEVCEESVDAVLNKREALYAVLTGIELDILAEEDKLTEPLLSILKNDYKLYGVDEVLPFSIVNLYGSIGMSNFGYLDKTKPGVISVLDNSEGVNTFLDDIVAGIAAAAASRIAHRKEDDRNY